MKLNASHLPVKCLLNIFKYRIILSPAVTAREAGASSKVMYSYGPPHMAEQKQDNQQLCEDMGCSPEDLPEAMNNRKKWRERVRDIRACGTTS